MTIVDLKAAAAHMASEFRDIPTIRDVPKPLRAQFIAMRSELFERGIYDPILARFDSATVPQASPQEIAEELAVLSTTL